MYVSTDSGIAAISMSGETKCSVQMGEAEAMCACGGYLFCACNRDRAIWRLDKGTLMPQAVYPGGPGMNALCCSGDSRKLFVLLGEADSVLMSDAAAGRALVINRCGCNPKRMRLCGGMLLIAGGEDGCVHVLDAATLEIRSSLQMPGPVYDAMLIGGRIHALCLTQSLSACLVTMQSGRRCGELLMEGMPGCLGVQEGLLFAATQGFLYAVSQNGQHILKRQRAPGRAGDLFAVNGTLMLRDPLSERLFLRGNMGGWCCVRDGVQSIALV